jgi:nitrogen-specific signal transduction histidine kinase
MSIALICGVLVAAIGLAVIKANPRRRANQAFALVSAVGIVWLSIVSAQMSARNVTTFMRANAITSPFVPWALALLHSSLLFPTEPWRRLFHRALPWLVIALALIPLCFAPSFVSPVIGSSQWQRGFAYAIHSIVLGLASLSVVILAARELHRQVGIRRLESLLLVITLGVGSLVCLALITAGNFFQGVQLKLLGLFVVFLTYGLIGWSITVQKIYDVRQILRRVGHCALVVAFLSAVLVGTWQVLKHRISNPADLLVSAAVASLAALWLEAKSSDWFDLNGKSKLRQLRQSIIHLSKAELLIEGFISKLQVLLRAECDSTFVNFLLDVGDSYADDRVSLLKSRLIQLRRCESGWITPENLQRGSGKLEGDELGQFLKAQSIGLLLCVPRGNPTPSMVVTFGTKTSECPFTYPEVERMLSIVELVDNILTHSRVAMQAALKTRIEYLAVMSRGLAHDLKNLITPVSSFLVHMEGRFPVTSHEAEIYAAAQSSVREMTGYVRETLSFAERLEPRFEPVDVFKICDTARQVLTSRAATRQIVISVRSEPRALFINADGVLIGRVLTNLVSNAIDASVPGQAVVICSSHPRPGWIRLDVSDNGCGIPAENLGRIFDPYFTTKRFGDEVRGFGLGLTICQKIVLLHGGKLSAKSEVGRGTTMTVDLPLEQKPAIA